MTDFLYLLSKTEVIESRFSTIASSHWNSAAPPKFESQVVTDVYKSLENTGFDIKSILILKNLHYFEKYLVPNWNDEAKDNHTLSIVLIFIANHSIRDISWDDAFASNESSFASLFKRVLTLAASTSITLKLRAHLITFIKLAFQSLDSLLVRREVAPLVSIVIWNSLNSSLTKETIFTKNPNLRKLWKSINKRYDAADEVIKTKLRLERGWFPSILVDFLQLSHNSNVEDDDLLYYANEFLYLLVTIVSQLPTRRFANTLLKDFNTSVILRLSPLFTNSKNKSLVKSLDFLDEFIYFPVDDFSGTFISNDELAILKSKEVLKFQKIALDHFKEKLLVLALANYGSVCKRTDLVENLQSLTDQELTKLCELVGISTTDNVSGISIVRELLVELLVFKYAKRQSLESRASGFEVLPTERSILASSYRPGFDTNAVKSNSEFGLQFLSIKDFLIRAFDIYKHIYTLELESTLEQTLRLLKPQASTSGLKVNRFSRHALKVFRPSVLEVGPVRVGETHPSFVRAEIYLDIDKVSFSVRKEWEQIQPGDSIYLISLIVPDLKSSVKLEQVGIKHLRAAEVVALYRHDNQFREVKNGNEVARKRVFNRSTRRWKLHVNIDPTTFLNNGDSVLKNVNFILRKNESDFNYPKTLDLIKDLLLSEFSLPDWLVDVFLGYGDPNSVSYKNLSNRLGKVNLNDTFVNWGHLVESFPDEKVVSEQGDGVGAKSPYVVEHVVRKVPAKPSPARGRNKKSHQKNLEPLEEKIVQVTFPAVHNRGPYPEDSPRTNSIRFTSQQVEAIYSGIQPGLTLISGSSGTGKTSVAAQAISVIHHNWPDQKILVTARSDEALDSIIEKLGALDLDELNLLRIGRDSGSLDSSISTIEQRRLERLSDVSQLAESLAIPGPHGETCEAAGYFYRNWISPLLDRFKEVEYHDVVSLNEAFPFHTFFEDAPQPLINSESHTLEKASEIVAGCFRHVERIFSDIETIRPFELLKKSKDKANYVLSKVAKVVFLKASDAPLKREEFARLGFRYETVIVDEAAQLTEIESFIPLTLQSTENGNPIERLILIGDRHQNVPVTSDAIAHNFGNVRQSLFNRLLRLGVPKIILDAQGISRSEIVDAYDWQNLGISSLEFVSNGDEYKFANAGFNHTLQFINVEDFNGEGETEPVAGVVQNLGEAEFATAIYMYMRLLGYPAERISILTLYSGQKSLIQNVLRDRCEKNPIFGLPGVVETVDNYQSRVNDYVILSLVRTNNLDFLIDSKKMTVALSRAKLGLYVLGRRSLLEASPEIDPFLSRIGKSTTFGDRLELSIGEMFPSSRSIEEIDDTKVVQMDGVEHLGAFVYEMTLKKVEQLKQGSQAQDSSRSETVNDEALHDSASESDDYSAGEEEQDEEEET
ncbi:P-loop containing nucleoside triphosphate hydrolase protein [Lipomyces japonicus]|uniref:P-loop containing nucleoside triphosphate hydrolase protein n=1 Tax=Lipomyces japonicus TaxID=56871 RepID=UPI0034CEE8CA